MKFYYLLFKYTLRKERLTALQWLGFVCRLCVYVYALFYWTAYMMSVYIIYRMFISYVMSFDNNLYLSSSDMLMMNLTRRKYERLFIIQRLFIHKPGYKIIYLLSTIAILISIKRLDILGSLIVTEMLFIIIELNYLKQKDSFSNNLISIKFLSEVIVLMIGMIYSVIFNPTTIQNHINELNIIIPLGYFIYTMGWLHISKKYKRNKTALFYSIFFSRISIFLYKEIKLFYLVFLENSVTLCLILLSFALDAFQLDANTTYFILVGIILNQFITLKRSRREVLNFTRDNFFLNPFVVSKVDYFLILYKKFESYFKLICCIKICLIMGVVYFFERMMWSSLIVIFLAMVVMILNEFNSFFITRIINIIFNHCYRYIFIAVILIGDYTQYYVLVFIIGASCLLYEIMSLRNNLCKEQYY